MIENSIIDINDFIKIDMRVGEIVKVENLDWSNKLLKLQVDFGAEIGVRNVLSGIKKWYSSEELLNKRFVFVINLNERIIKNEVSQAMILMIEGKHKPLGWQSVSDEAELGAKVG